MTVFNIEENTVNYGLKTNMRWMWELHNKHLDARYATRFLLSLLVRPRKITWQFHGFGHWTAMQSYHVFYLYIYEATSNLSLKLHIFDKRWKNWFENDSKMDLRSETNISAPEWCWCFPPSPLPPPWGRPRPAGLPAARLPVCSVCRSYQTAHLLPRTTGEGWEGVHDVWGWGEQLLGGGGHMLGLQFMT